MLCLLYPVVRLEGGDRLPLVLLPGVPLFAWAFVAWERRTTRRGHPPLLDLELLRTLPGYLNGLAVGALYFTGFTGVLLVLSLYLQDGRGATPLQAGLLIMPFAVGLRDQRAARPAGSSRTSAAGSPWARWSR